MKQYQIPFNKPYFSGNETKYIEDAVRRGKISGNGYYTQKCQAFFEERYGFLKTFMTTSCTHALEMAAMLMDIQPGDEVIMPTYTFVSSALPFVSRGAHIVFADSSNENPNLDVSSLKALISKRTKAILVVHYGGVACEMDEVMSLAESHQLFVVEDAAHAIDSSYKGRPLGSIGHFGAFSFHETKNVISGEGGMLCVNEKASIARAEVVWEKGTNRTAFFRGDVAKYTWVDQGASFQPSEIVSAFLFAQLEKIDQIQAKRRTLWQQYYDAFAKVPALQNKLPHIPESATKNGHLFHLVCESLEQRSALIEHYKLHSVYAVFHYQSLHDSPFYEKQYNGGLLPNADRYTDCLVRLPLFYELTGAEQDQIIALTLNFFSGSK